MSFYFSSFFHRVNMLHGVSIVESSVDWTFFRWFVYKQIIFTENPSTQPHEMQQPHFISSLSSRTLVQFTSMIQSISLHIETLLLFLLLHEFIFEKHFDQLNSKCECHWIWHRWMISVQSKRINEENRKERYLNGGNKHDSTFFSFDCFRSFVDYPDCCTDESERMVCVIGAVETRWWQKKMLHDLELSRCLSYFPYFFILILMIVSVGYWSHIFKGWTIDSKLRYSLDDRCQWPKYKIMSFVSLISFGVKESCTRLTQPTHRLPTEQKIWRCSINNSFRPFW